LTGKVDAYIGSAPKQARVKLRQVRAAIREAAPLAEESFSYGMPCYSYKGRLAWFGLQRGYVGLYLRPPVIAEHKKELAGYFTTKSAVHLPMEGEMPIGLVKKLVRARVKKNQVEE
jgi:uncharacterized protein YdhG (YjbR/CyaY superfamily)